jgi:hypothetical protein
MAYTYADEPYVVHATVRESWTDDGRFACWDIECRFSDGQKFAAISVDHNFERLADFICKKIIWEGAERARHGFSDSAKK